MTSPESNPARRAGKLAPAAIVYIGTAVCVAMSATISAQESAAPQSESNETIVVTGQRVYPISEVVAPAGEQALDTAELLAQLPGAGVNANGAITGIAQYRGLFGDRVSVSIDGLGVLSGGPNAMDPPLAYAAPLLLEHLSLERGIASVSSSSESLGGHISADYDRGDFVSGSDVDFTGSVQARYESNGEVAGTAARFVVSNDTHKFALLGETAEADDFDYPDGQLTPTRFDRTQHDVSYRFRTDTFDLLVHTGELDTGASGTPALPMDIDYIDTQIHGVRLRTEGERAIWSMAYSRSSVDHQMDNFSLRTPPGSPMGYRTNHATADGQRWRLDAEIPVDDGEWRFGIDGAEATHDALIGNPNMPPFAIANFNEARRELLGVFGQWNRLVGRFDIETGVRFNQVDLSAGTVSASIPPMNAMMQMMGMNAGMLATAFNNSERGREHSNVDAVFKIGRVLDSQRKVYFEVARKTRAPSYQEAFLWLPLEATGGLADGRSYLGNSQLSSEVSHELNIGTDWRGDRAWFSPQVFYKQIDDYIQGVPSTNMTANMVANMMTGMPALEFANTDAELVGLDVAWGVSLGAGLSLQGLLSWVDGERTDVEDSLYRIAPLNGNIALVFDKPAWQARLEVLAFDGQDDVAAYNNEQASAGYGVLNARMQWRGSDALRVYASVENLLDRNYQPHLGSYNRVMAVDVPVGERLFGIGRNFNVGIGYSW